MTSDKQPPSESNQPADAAAAKPLSEAAKRALAEAAERRKLHDAQHNTLPKEINGRDGPEPVRYGDWEKNGIASDF
ncbi:DUF1674 domain-containing protein [Beijerinckia indica]|uniref:DUF1674 domain-containing protein n=1 Tax=Beijerinckia indica subsp. indica (strain ATCC 9039 / DSM 1715 / NCIMB 8712) TaxID=395963 RepID=B2IFV4_BEII9|nr:DUF1674 domain-containing protein [Beijerinckia indica]ACB95693.1 protein of unknown function DUF1674 [Beijerinckia indica subsp. indica ATCC 9039]